MDPAANAAAGLAFAAALGVAAIWDLRTRRVPNAITFAVAVAGLAVASWEGAPLRSAAGIGAGLAVLWLPWTRAWVGGGDLKLLGASGAWLGPGGVVAALALAAVALAVLMAVTWAACSPDTRRDVRRNLVSMALWRAPAPAGLRARPARESVPLGAAIAAGAAGAWWLR